jgi:hypothetical protein
VYNKLERVLTRAKGQASEGKGKQRHAKEGEPFEKQKICEITRRVGIGYPLGQAIKKTIESKRLPRGADVEELLGAINYLAAAIIILEEWSEEQESADTEIIYPGSPLDKRLQERN